MTGAELVTKALRKAGIITKTETPSADEINDGISDLNAILGGWANESMMAYARTLENFTLTAGVNSYTIGSGQTFNTTRPVFIASAYVRDAFDYPVELINDEAYAAIQDKSSEGRPTHLNFNNAFPSATIKLYPTPSQAYTLYLLSEKPLSSISDTTDVSLPPGWEDALVYTLAVKISPEYGQEPSPMLVSMAIDAKAAIRSSILKNRTMDAPINGETRNIYTGWFR